jgi:hypothetical protein
MKTLDYVFVSAMALMAGCGNTSVESTVRQTPDGYQVSSGLAQKGPLGRGSIVTINELDSTKLAPNGKSYTYETKDDLGTFAPTSVFSGPYLEVTAQGYFFNEMTGVAGKDWVVLRGLSNLSAGADKAVNVNVLSNMTKDRIRALMNGTPAVSFAAARLQAQRELLKAFYIYNSSDLLAGDTSAPGNFMELDLSRARQADQLLATISGMVTAIGQSGGGFNAFMNRAQADLADDGLLNNSPAFAQSVQSQINQAASSTNFAQVAINLNSFYGLGNSYTRSNLAQWVDSSGGVDQVIDKNKLAADGVPFDSESKSPAYTASTDDASQCLSVSGGKLYKNGTLQTGATLAAKGDKFVIGLTPTAWIPQVSQFLLRSAPATDGSCNSSSAVRLYKYTVSGTGQTAAATPLPAEYLGANLPGISDYSYTPVYADLVNQGRRFGPATGPWGYESVPVGDDGWPTGDFGIFLMTAPGRGGTYKVSFTGQATVNHVASASTSLANKQYDPVTNVTTLDVIRGSDGQQLVLTFTNTGTGIKNLKVVRPGYDALNPPLFTQEFLDHIARFKTLRFMDWLKTNNNNVVTSWATRATLNTHYASDAGVPWEHIIALSNQTGKDIWINIPVSADDGYVQQLAQLLKSTLRSDVKIYVEYSNELWNWSFWQYGTNHDLATAEVNANPSSPLVYDHTTDTNTMMYRRSAKRGKEISDIFRSVYGDAAMMSTVRPVFASQVVQPYVTQLGLDFIDAVYGPPSHYFYALAGAPYYNMGSKQTVDGLTVDQVLDALDTSVTNLPAVNYFEKNLALARWYSLPFIGYEGGSDTFGLGSIAAKKAASLDARMLNICRRYMDTWFANGGEMMMWFTAGAGNWDTQYGTWELTTDLSLTNTPKIQCMDNTLAGVLPPLQGRNVVPGTFNALAYVGNAEPYSDASKIGLRYLHPSSYVDYLVLAPQGGTYALVISAESSTLGNTVDVFVNGKPAVTGFEFKAQGWGIKVDNDPIALPLNKGFNTIRIKTKTENLGYSMSTLTVQ